jgi:oligogalacturonide lyase
MTRRAMLVLLPASLAAQTRGRSTKPRARPLPSVGEFVRFADPSTETPVVRLTSTTSSSLLPAPANRFVSVKDRFLIFSSDRTGKFAPFKVDLRSGLLRQIAGTSNLSPLSLSLAPHERSLYFIDGGELKEADLTRPKVETLADNVASFSVAPAGSGVFAVRGGKLQHVNGREITTLAEDVSDECLAQPGTQAGCLFMRHQGDGMHEFWCASVSNAGAARPVLLASGRISDPYWTPQGESIIFLRDVSRGGTLFSEIHEAAVSGGAESLVTTTSQFAAFSPNGDGSVFVGASRSKAQPVVMLLLRSGRSEMTLCEHHSSQPAQVCPVFSPDAKRVYFQSDRQGKTAIYSVNVELLVEPLLS